MKKLLFLSGAACWWALNLTVPACAEAKTVVTISSKKINPYEEALAGFKEELKKREPDVVFKDYDLKAIGDKEDDFFKTLKETMSDLIFTLGTESTLFAQQKIKGLPLLFSMVLNPRQSGIVASSADPDGYLTGVSLDIPPELQFVKLKEMLPKASRVGIIYNAKEIKEIKAVLDRMGLTMVAKPVRSEADVPQALNEIVGSVDCVWAQADSLIYNAQSSQYILLTLLRNKIPLMAFSSQYVKAGALFALECDYGDIGRQSAEIAARIMGEGPRETLTIAFPEKTHLVVNRRIADLIGAGIPETILKEAREVDSQ
jgi:putative ABC transport system substrate-binding protein